MSEGERRIGRRSGRARTTRLRVSVADERGRPLGLHGLATWLASVAPRRARGQVTIALVSDRRVRALNQAYRRRDRITDVLSFAAADDVRGADVPASERFLGDIVIARGVAARQGRAAGHGEQTELRILALHGLLHLLGFDHERDNGTMRRVEQRLRRKGGLREGLIERTGA
jgi:probable rRNA maturation factor